MDGLDLSIVKNSISKRVLQTTKSPLTKITSEGKAQTWSHLIEKFSLFAIRRTQAKLWLGSNIKNENERLSGSHAVNVFPCSLNKVACAF